MAERIVHCAKLKRDLPGLDENSAAGSAALKMVLLIGGPELQKKVREQISAEAWKMWTDYQVMVVNEYRLDPTSDRANEVLRKHMEEFLFGTEREIPNYVPPK